MNNIKIKILYFDRIEILKELMLMRQANKKSALFVIIGIFQKKRLSFNLMFATDVTIF